LHHCCRWPQAHCASSTQATTTAICRTSLTGKYTLSHTLYLWHSLSQAYTHTLSLFLSHTNTNTKTNVDRFADFTIGLSNAIDKNRGLDHSKVREYWLDRAPKLFLTAVLFIVFTIVCQEIFLPGSRNKMVRTKVVVVNTGALVVAILMVYWRLQNSIKASISRSAHDYYVESKTQIFGTVKKNGNSEADISTASSESTLPWIAGAKPRSRPHFTAWRSAQSDS
jgi:hypothetical protein